MKPEDYHCTITAPVTPAKALEAISRVPEWWVTNYEGQSQNLGDVFTVRFGESFVTFALTDFVAGQRVVWQVIDCHLHWLTDKKEWNGTKIDWEITPKGDLTEITLTHVGLVPAIECYDDCQAGWNSFVAGSLHQLLTVGQGSPH